MKSARRDALAPIRRGCTMRRPVPAQAAHGRHARRARVPAGRARDRGDAAVADRPRRSARPSSLLFCVALAWACCGHDRHRRVGAPARSCRAAAPRSSSRSRPASCAPIHVQDGQAVKAGDVLIELDPTMNAAERDHLHNDLARRAARRRAAARGAGRRRRPVGRLRRRRRTPIRRWSATQRSCCSNQVAEHRAKLAALDASAGAEGGRAGHDRGHDPQARGDDSGIQQRVDIRKTLMEKELGSKLTYLRDRCSCWSSSRRSSASRTATCTRPRRRSPRSARRAARRSPSTGARCPTNSPRPSRRRAGSPRT